jgi:hypothetical protein
VKDEILAGLTVQIHRVQMTTAAAIIDEIKALPPSAQAEVIQFAVELARSRQLTRKELGELADKLAASNDPAEIA